MDIHLLGPIEATLDGQPVSLGSPQQRAVLAMLALEVNRTVSADRLIDGLWAERAPPTAPKMVQLYVSRLRRLMGDDEAEIVTRGRGYELRLAADQVDVARVERLVAEAERGDNGDAREALSLWRGTPLADVAHEPFASAEIRRLEDLRLQAAELAIDADLAAGRHREILGELRAMIVDEPLRERLRAQHMLALYRSGRQADALEEYREARTALVEAIGVEPGPELRRLHEAILRQDPGLELPAAAGLAPQLDAGLPLIGRDEELDRLRGHWRRAVDGGGRLVLVVGGRGLGKTRLVAELATEVLRDGGEVVYVSGSEPAPPASAVARRPKLLVLDEVDPAGEPAALAGLETLPLLVVATTTELVPATTLRAVDTLVLEPLDADGVRTVAEFYAGAREPVPVERLVAASGGVPRHVHRAASEWSRALEADRLAATAGRLAVDRPTLRAAEDELVGDIVRRQAARVHAGSEAVADVCPFKGLASFEPGDAGFFFGRERLVAEMVARVTGTPLMGIVGPSGSGKSSALKAGLLSALAGGVLPGSERWALAVLRPGAHPLRALGAAVAAASGDGRLVVAVDQFEETFTTCRDEPERAAFVDALVASVRDPRRPTSVIVAVRADYYGRCAAYAELSRLLGAGHVLVGPMRPDGLRRAIELPASRAGLELEPALADALVDDLEGRPGALPLLSTSLLELWQRRDGRRLTLGAHARAGGVSGAVARLAESAYERLEPAQRQVARRLLIRLAGEGEGDAVVRRRVPLAELEVEREHGVAEVLRRLADDRLVTVGDDQVEVAHEALLREWPRLRGWLEEDAEGRRVHQHLIHAATDWEASGRDPAELYRGARSVTAAEWAETHDAELNALEREFLTASRTEAQLEADRRRRANRRLRASLAGVAALLVLAVVAGAVALSQRSTAREAAMAADAQRLGAEALTRDELDHALLLARAGIDLDDSAATRGTLLSAVQRSPAMLGTLTADGWPLLAVAVSPDQRLAAVGSERGTVTIFDTASRRAISTTDEMPDGYVSHLRFSPDGRTLAVAGHERKLEPGGLVDLVDPRTGERRRRIVLPPHPEPAGWIETEVEFGPDGRDVLTLQIHEFPNPTGPASVLRRYDARTGEARGRALRVGRHSSLWMTQTADRRSLFLTSAQDRATFEVDARTSQVRRRHPVGDTAGGVSPDGRWFALGSPQGRVRLLDLRTGRVRRFAGGHDAKVFRLVFKPDGRTLVTSAEDGTLLVWDVRRGEIREELSGYESGVETLEVAPDGRSLYSAGLDGRALVFDLAPDRRLDRPFSPGPPFETDDGDQYPRGLAMRPDGRVLAVAQGDGTVDLLDARTLRKRATLAATRRSAIDLAFSADGRRLAVTGVGGQTALFDARTLRRTGELRGLRRTSQAIAFSPDGRLLAAAEVSTLDETGLTPDTPARVRIFDVRRRELVGSLPGSAASIAFSPDGRRLAVASLSGGRTDIREVRGGRLVARLPNDDLVRSVAWAPQGTLVATGEYDGAGQLWSTRTWKRVGPPLEGHDKRLQELEFSRDGRVLSSGAADGTVRLWDVATRRPLGSPLTVEADAYIATAFAPDGRHLFAASGGRRAVRWNVSVDAWKHHACRVAGRELTRREWREALPGRPYRTVCSAG